MSTNVLSAKQIKRQWQVVDAKDKILGRLATEVAKVLMGKNKSQFVPYLDSGDHVVVINASQVKVSGKKSETKKYARHSGYPGGYREERFDELLARKPENIITHAVKGMVPKTKLGREMMKKLHVFAGNQHSFQNKMKGEEVV